jgi:uncharacterized integral membrane protein
VAEAGHAGDRRAERGRERNWKLWGAGAAVVLALIFILLNNDEVTIDFLVAEAEMSLAFALLISTLLGILIGWLLPLVRRGRHRH